MVIVKMGFSDRIRKLAAQYSTGLFVRKLCTILEDQVKRLRRIEAKGLFVATYWAGHKEVAALELQNTIEIRRHRSNWETMDHDS